MKKLLLALSLATWAFTANGMQQNFNNNCDNNDTDNPTVEIVCLDDTYKKEIGSQTIKISELEEKYKILKEADPEKLFELLFNNKHKNESELLNEKNEKYPDKTSFLTGNIFTSDDPEQLLKPTFKRELPDDLFFCIGDTFFFNANCFAGETKEEMEKYRAKYKIDNDTTLYLDKIGYFSLEENKETIFPVKPITDAYLAKQFSCIIAKQLTTDNFANTFPSGLEDFKKPEYAAKNILIDFLKKHSNRCINEIKFKLPREAMDDLTNIFAIMYYLEEEEPDSNKEPRKIALKAGKKTYSLLLIYKKKFPNHAPTSQDILYRPNEKPLDNSY